MRDLFNALTPTGKIIVLVVLILVLGAIVIIAGYFRYDLVRMFGG